MRCIKKFIKSIYVGDRYCENIEIREDKISIQINCISRLEEGTKEWNYYSKDDIEHGYIVFDDVVEYDSSSELILNDEIYEIDVIEKTNGVYSFVVYGCNISDDAISTDIELRIKAEKIYILNPKNNCIITK